jgi:hypothetical protein
LENLCLLQFHIEEKEKKRTKRGREITKDRVSGVPGDLILGCFTDQTPFVSEGNLRRRRPVALIVHYDLYSIMLPHSHARIRRPQINPYRWPLSFAAGHSRRLGDHGNEIDDPTIALSPERSPN